ncbi:MAG: hypothetical protein II939_16270 [Bacteroidales bacterium]|nr:hypothetical protein [Bacteroidales bacterium]
MKKLTFLAASAAIMLAACSEPLQEEAEINKSKEPTKVEKTISHWGNKIEDPYTVENMRRAYDELTKGETQSLTKKGLQKEQITTTHLSVKFIPKDENEWRILKLDTILDVVPIPFDYDLEGFDGNYRDPECPAGQPTYQYSVVRIGYPLPNVEYEILDSLFMPFEDEYEQTSLSKKAGMRQIWDELETESIKLTGNWEEEEDNSLSKKKRMAPTGKVVMIDFSNNGEEKGVPNVRIHMNFSTHKSNAITNANGDWESPHSFKNRVHSHIYFENADYYASNFSGQTIAWYRGRVKLEKNEIFKMDKRDEANYAATIMLAGYDYFNNKLNANTPNKNQFIRIGLRNFTDEVTQKPVNNTTEYGAHYKEGHKDKVFVKGVYGNNMAIYATTIYGLAYSTLQKHAKIVHPNEHNLLQESYLACVAYVFAEHKYGSKYDPQNFRTNYRLQNSGFFVDMIDGINTNHRDYVEGYTLENIESLLSTYRISSFQDVIEQMPKITSNSTYNGLTDLSIHWHDWSSGRFSK